MEIKKIITFLPIFILEILTLGKVECTGSSNSKLKHKLKRESYSQNTLQYGAPGVSQQAPINRSYYQHRVDPSSGTRRSLAIPKGTKLTLTPNIEIPILDDKENHGVGCSLSASVPVSFKFNDMTWSNFGHDLFDWHWQMGKPSHRSFSDFDQQFVSTTVNEADRHSRIARDVTRFSSEVNLTTFTGPHLVKKNVNYPDGKCLVKNLSDRKMVLQKLEMLVSNFGISNPKACLLRAACEIHHEIPLQSGLGLLGEVITSVFSVQELSKDCKGKEAFSTLTPFAEAELAGKTRNCNLYKKQCSKSIFSDVI